ncbi:MAG: hypothetical protein ACI9KN_001052 [Gammaproteobacteria bacterium]|jgi:hypothetical protein
MFARRAIVDEHQVLLFLISVNSLYSMFNIEKLSRIDEAKQAAAKQAADVLRVNPR